MAQKKMSKRTKKKIMKAIFGKALPIVTLIIALLSVAFYCAYNYSEPFHTFVDEVVLGKTTIAPRPYIDPDGSELAVHFIDVGQGDSALLQTAQGSVLIDCGEYEYRYVVQEYLQKQGVYELEYFIITHPDSDHMGSAAYILENIPVKTLIINGQEKDTMEEVLDVVLEKQIDTVIVGQDEEIKVGGTISVGALQIDILGPQHLEYSVGEYNNPSIVLYARFGHRSFLFTGDAEKAAEKDLVEKFGDVIDCDVFSAGHHGSSTSNTQILLDAAKPEFVVISCGADNRYNHPSGEVKERFENNNIEILRTDLNGSVVFITDGEELEIIKEKTTTTE